MARQAGLQRDHISRYIRGASLPTPQNLDYLARALDVDPKDLLPDGLHRKSVPAVEMQIDGESVWLRFERAVSLETATKIIELLKTDRAFYGDVSPSA